MINHRRWVALLLCAAMTVSSATVLAAGDTTPDDQTDVLPVSDAVDDAGQRIYLFDEEGLASPEDATPPQPEGVTLTLNGQAMALSATPVILEGNTYVPLRAFCEAMGCTVSWSSTGLATITRGDELMLEIQQGSDLVRANDRYFYMPDICKIINGSLMVPIRGLAKVFTLTIAWDADSQTVALEGGQVLAWAESFYNADDLLWLSRIIHAESRGEPLEGKIAVGNVVLNRTQASQFPDSIYDVIFQGNGTQFTPVRSGKVYNTPSDESVLAAKLCLEGHTEVSDALYFLNVSVSKSGWIVKNRTLVAKIGCHSFYS